MASTLALATPCLRNVRSAKACRSVLARAADRPVWNPGEPAPAWLDGSLPGDYGFDPLGLGSDPGALKYFVQAELVHGRFAMLGCAGILIPGLMTKAGVLNVPDWTVAGEVAIKEQGIPFWALVMAQIFAMGWAEVGRYQMYKNPDAMKDVQFMPMTQVADGYPGGIFDPMGMGMSKELQTKEIKNGRLAMVSMVGYYAQHAATGKGPIDNLFDHIANPGFVNFATNGVSLPHPPAIP